jgi:hypothetical protein
MVNGIGCFQAVFGPAVGKLQATAHRLLRRGGYPRTREWGRSISGPDGAKQHVEANCSSVSFPTGGFVFYGDKNAK